MQLKEKNQVYFKSLFQNFKQYNTKKEKKVILANQKKGKKIKKNYPIKKGKKSKKKTKKNPANYLIKIFGHLKIFDSGIFNI